MTIQSFEIKYETAPNVPPPYCYYLHVKGRHTPAGIDTAFEWVYHNREDMTPEEIEDEGFSGDDDVVWQGVLSANWLRPMAGLLGAAAPAGTAPGESAPFLELDFEEAGGPGFSGVPANTADWEYLLQELTQGVYETAGHESPLLIRYKKITPANTLYCSVRMQFADRQATLQTRIGDAKLHQRPGEWDALKTLLGYVFSLEYLSEKGEHREPHQPGTYLDIGQNTWFSLGKTALDPSLKINTLSRIERAFDQLIRQQPD